MHESEKWKWSLSVMSDSSNPMDCSLPSSSVHGIFQARVMEWGAIAFSHNKSNACQNYWDFISHQSDWKKTPKFGNVNFARLYKNGHFHTLQVRTSNGTISMKWNQHYLAKLHMYVLFDPAIICLGVNLKYSIANIWRHMQKAFHMALFVTAKGWNNSNVSQ